MCFVHLISSVCHRTLGNSSTSMLHIHNAIAECLRLGYHTLVALVGTGSIWHANIPCSPPAFYTPSHAGQDMVFFNTATSNNGSEQLDM